ncbi:MAG TPA: metallophosphoesterase [bacterium]|nr:metallophosphoesterase [bacterium]
MATLLPHLSGSDKPLEFVVFGDCHFNDIDNPDSTILKKIVEEINRKNPDAEFAVNLGDIVVVEKNPVAYDKAIENYLKVIKNLKIPVYHVPGNHDMTNNEQIRKIYENKITPLYYSVKKNNTLLIFLNSECLDESQIKWLRNQLEKPAKTKIVFGIFG